MQMSAAGRASLTEPWEDCILYPYDDKAGLVRVDGKLVPPEWNGGPVKGTITIGYGHTEAAGPPAIYPGMKITKAQADEFLSRDLSGCESAVNRALKVEISQHQYDALVDLTFNCPSALPHVAALINSGHPEDVAGVLHEYVYSRGEYMPGLVHRRNAEIAWFNTPDSPEVAESQLMSAPQAEREPQPKPSAQSKVIAGTSVLGSGGILASLQSANDAAVPIKEAKRNLVDFGVFDHLVMAAHQPLFWVGVAVISVAIFIFFDRRAKLVGQHV